MTLHCNGGNTYTHKVVSFEGFVGVWLNLNGITNILLLKEVSKKYQVRCKCEPGGKAFVVKYGQNSIIFIDNNQGLCMHNTSKCEV